MNPKIKNILIFVGIGLILVLIYVFLIKKDNSKENLESTKQVNTQASNLENNGSIKQIDKEKIEQIEEKITALLKLEKIILDDSIFKKDAFNNLVEHTITLEKDLEIGRPNPFANVERGSEFNTIVSEGQNIVNTLDTNTNTIKTPVLPDTTLNPKR